MIETATSTRNPTSRTIVKVLIAATRQGVCASHVPGSGAWVHQTVPSRCRDCAHWHASQDSPFFIASIEQAAFSAAVYVFFAATAGLSVAGNGLVETSPAGTLAPSAPAAVPAWPRTSFLTETV